MNEKYDVYRALIKFNNACKDWDDFVEKLEALIGEYGDICTYSKVLVSEDGELLTVFENKNETNVLAYYNSDGPVTVNRLG